jgi:hypothetical protein
MASGRESTLTAISAAPLLARWGQRYVVGGTWEVRVRRRPCPGWSIKSCISSPQLPRAGDNTPGFIALSPTRAIMSWYSSHEKDESGKSII